MDPVERALQAYANLRQRVDAQGGELLETKWLGSREAHRVRCGNGHAYTITPGTWKPTTLCRRCRFDKVSERAWQEFRERVATQGGVVLEPRWLGNQVAHLVRCREGHENRPHPKSIQQGQGICRTCAGNDPEGAWRRFRERVEERGGTVVEPRWLGSDNPHRVRCMEGHDCLTRPIQVHQGYGFCLACVGRDPDGLWDRFKRRVEELGGTVVETEWLGSRAAHRVRCPKGHDAAPRPERLLGMGGGLCLACSGKDPKSAEAAFRARIAELGGVLLERKWLGSSRPHRARCGRGHYCNPRPASLNSGYGMCRFCPLAHEWNVFYVVADDDNDQVKLGITSDDPRPRLRQHARNGFTRTVRLMQNLPEALTLERLVLSALDLAGERPTRGREYFRAQALATILDVADNYTPAVPAPRQCEQTQLF